MNIYYRDIHKYLLYLSSCLLLCFISSKSLAQNSSSLTGQLLDGILAGMEADVELDDVIAAMEGRPVIKNATDDIFGALNYLDNLYSEDVNYNPGFNDFNQKNFGLSPILPGTAVLPIMGQITSRFGYRPSFGRMHKGVDIGLQIGDTIVASMDGTVARVAQDPKGYGLFVCLTHPNGMETRYAHLSRALVIPSMRVKAGQPIALGGNTGNSTGPHLHFETIVNGKAVDPTTMFDFNNPSNFSRPRRRLTDLDEIMAGMSPGNYFDQSSGQESTSNQPKRKTYVVKTGDTIASVAQKNGISILSLCRLNMLSANETLQPGRMLKLR